jgi:FixJ family two-component response regulator
VTTEPTQRKLETSPIVFVVDDDDSVRESVCRLLRSADLTVEAFASAQDFLAAFSRREVPSCLVLDVFLPGLSGLGLQARLAEMPAQPAIVFLTGHGDIPMSVRAIKAGALEFFTKPFDPEKLLAGVRNAIERERRDLAERSRLTQLRKRHATLTAREREVMAGVLGGLANKQIAARFGTSEVTVKEQRARVMRKMSASSAADLVRMGLELGVPALGETGGGE